jgi:hypothetical protein
MWYNILAVGAIMCLVIIWIAVKASETPSDEVDPNVQDDSEDDLNKN